MTTSDQGEPRIEVARRVADLESLHEEWRRLAEACPTATVFQTPEWNITWWRTLGRGFGRSLRVIAFRDTAGELVGFAPLMTSFWYGTPLRRLSFLGAGATDYHDVLAAEGFEERVVAALYRHLAESGGWQIADLQQLREDSLLRRVGQPIPRSLWSMDTTQEPCPHADLPPTWEEFAGGLGKKTRTNIAYHDRTLAKVFQLEFGAVEDESALDDAMSRMFELHQRRWNQRWLPGVFHTRAVRRFHREVARALLRSNMLRLFTLRLDGDIEASLYCFAFRDRVCYYQGGFEPTLAKYSLGTVLTARAIQSAIAEGRTCFDFLRGDEPYKRKWTQSTQVNARRLITRRASGLAPLVMLARRVEEAVEHRVKEWARGRR